MSTSPQNFKQYSFAHHEDVYIILEEVFSIYNIKYYLIGANARDVQLYKRGIKPSRGTGDIDFAIMVPDIETYDCLFTELCNRGFLKAKEPHRLYYEKTNTAIDLLPYGEIEEAYTVNFVERNLILSVLGFREVGDSAEVFPLPNSGSIIPVTPVEGIFILKLVSWSEKPAHRIKDLEDISYLLKHAWDLYEEDAYDDHLDLFDDDDFEVIKVSARIIGRKMRPILDENLTLKETIVSILKNSIQDKDKAENPEVTLAQEMNKTIDEIQEILHNILIGIHD